MLPLLYKLSLHAPSSPPHQPTNPTTPSDPFPLLCALVASMPARHFCFCLPLRLGAFLISLCQLALGGLLAAVNWYALESLRA